jgi:hypothetical protein
MLFINAYSIAMEKWIKGEDFQNECQEIGSCEYFEYAF